MNADTTTSRRVTAPKIDRLRRIMQARGLDAIVLCSYQNVSYFGGTNIMTQGSLPDRLAFLVARRGGAPTLLVCNIETAQVRSQTDIEDVREYVEFVDDPSEALATLLRESGLQGASIGFDARRLAAAPHATLQTQLGSAELVPVDDEIEAAQSVKDPDEIAVLEHGARVTLCALEEGIAGLALGSSELDATAAIYSRLLRAGGQPLFAVFASGPRTTHGHPEPVDEPMTRGAVWRIDFGARFAGGIVSDLARTGVVGEATAEQRATLKALRAAQDAGFRAAEPGRPAKEVFFAVRDEFARQGLPFSMPHVGHGMGIGLHEYPLLEPGNDQPLEAGMVLNIEPLVLISDRREGYHTEDLAEVTADGPRLLTPPQEDLLVIP